jgi:hypothetical protein
MRLWTWQNPDFSLANKQQKVESIKYSIYLNHDYIAEEQRNRHKTAYQKVWERLGSDQILWCFTRYEEAIDEASIEEFGNRGYLLWEIDTPEDKIIKYCVVAWNYLRTGKPKIPNGFYNSWKNLEISELNKRNKLVKNFEEYWKDKKEQQLLGAMFLEKFVNGCSEAIVFHPVERIERNPKTEGKWWLGTRQEETSYELSSSEGEQIMPCAQCPGRLEN